jgi:hypothetical protein
MFLFFCSIFVEDYDVGHVVTAHYVAAAIKTEK